MVLEITQVFLADFEKGEVSCILRNHGFPIWSQGLKKLSSLAFGDHYGESEKFPCQLASELECLAILVEGQERYAPQMVALL